MERRTTRRAITRFRSTGADRPSWDASAVVVFDQADGDVLVKSSHIYQASGVYSVTVYVTGPDGQTSSADTTSVDVSLMPDPASRPPQTPAVERGPKPLGVVSLTLGGVPVINAVAGSAFTASPIGTIVGTYDGATDNTSSDYKVQINWGDGPSWDTSGSLTYDSASGGRARRGVARLPGPRGSTA